jgi:hypothetical protein
VATRFGKIRKPADRHNGQRLKLATRICLGEVSGLQVEAARLIYSAKVRSDFQGNAFLEMWVHLAGGQYFSRGLDRPIAGKSEWTTLQTPFFLQKAQKPDRVTLNLVVNGRGTVWIADVTLTRAPLS